MFLCLLGQTNQPFLDEAENVLNECGTLQFDTLSHESGRNLLITAFSTGEKDILGLSIRDNEIEAVRKNELVRIRRLYALLGQLNRAASQSRSRDKLLRLVCQAFVERGLASSSCAIQRTISGGEIEGLAPQGEDQSLLASLCSSDGRGPGLALFEEAVRANSCLFIDDLQLDAAPDTWRGILFGKGFHSVATLPLRFRDMAPGLIILCSPAKGAYRSEEKELLDMASELVSHAVENLNAEAIRVKAVADLQESKVRFRRYFDSVPIAYASLDRQGTMIEINAVLRSLLLIGAQDVAKRSCSEFIVPRHANRFWECFRTLSESGGEPRSRWTLFVRMAPSSMRKWTWASNSMSKTVFVRRIAWSST
jgi:PAS domain S-box-containing protein